MRKRGRDGERERERERERVQITLTTKDKQTIEQKEKNRRQDRTYQMKAKIVQFVIESPMLYYIMARYLSSSRRFPAYFVNDDWK